MSLLTIQACLRPGAFTGVPAQCTVLCGGAHHCLHHRATALHATFTVAPTLSVSLMLAPWPPLPYPSPGHGVGTPCSSSPKTPHCALACLSAPLPCSQLPQLALPSLPLPVLVPLPPRGYRFTLTLLGGLAAPPRASALQEAHGTRGAPVLTAAPLCCLMLHCSTVHSTVLQLCTLQGDTCPRAGASLVATAPTARHHSCRCLTEATGMAQL